MQRKKGFYGIIVIMIILIVFVVILVTKPWNWFAKPEPRTLTVEELVESLRNQSVMITAGNSKASGVIIGSDEKNVYIVTAKHLIGDNETGILLFTTGDVGFADVFYTSGEYDIGFLKLNKENIDSQVLQELGQANIDMDAYDFLKEEDSVVLVGSAISAGSNAIEGTIASVDFYVPDFDSRMLYLYCDVMEGMSGCGAYDREGHLIGIIVGGSKAGESVCVKIRDVMGEYEQAIK